MMEHEDLRIAMNCISGDASAYITKEEAGALRRAIKELIERREQSGWKKTAFQLPKNGQFVLAYCYIDRPTYGLVEYTDFGEGLTCWTDPGTGNTFPIGMFTHWQSIERPYSGEDHKKDVMDYNLKMLTGQEWGREKLCQ